VALRKIDLAAEPTVVICATTVSAAAVVESVDIQMTDSEGNVVVDTRQRRIETKQEYAELFASKRRADVTLYAMLESYANAVSPDYS